MGKLALMMIVKPSDEEALNLDKCLASVSKYVDGIFITLAGHGTNKKCEEVCDKYNAVVSHFEWNDNFADARNFNMEQVPSDYEWVLWLDSDDEFKNPQKIKKIIENTDPMIMSIWVNYIYQRDKSGNTLIEHWRERIVRNNAGYRWNGALHETLMNESNPPMAKTTEIEVIHDLHDEDQSKSIRNLQILEKEISNQMDRRDKNYEEIDPRTLYYLGTTYKTLGMNEEAEEILRKFVNLSGWDEHRYGAYLDLVDIAITLNAKKPAMDYALMALGEFPQYPDGYFMAGKVCSHFLDYKKAIEWINMGFTKPKATGDWVLVGREQQALLDLSISYINLGDFKNSKKSIDKLVKMNPDDEKIAELSKENSKMLELRETTDRLLKDFKKADKTGKKKIFESIPIELKDSPIVFAMEREVMGPKKWSDKSIVINCAESWEYWSPKSEDSGIGGSEEAVIQMGKELTKLGYEVTVYNSCGTDAGTYDGVTYKDILSFNYEDEFNILIGWRYPGFFNRKFKAKKTYLWMHDVANPLAFTPIVLENVTKVILLSKYHRSLFQTIPEEKVLYSANGLVPEHFNGTEERKLQSLIYSSCPSRGLEVLLDMWPEIKEKYKDATLNVYYGWGNFEKGNANNPSKMAWLEQMKQKIKQPGITFHGRIGHKELAREMMKSDIWAYPCIFPEIYCITADKAQASGACPVVIPFGAVDERVQYGYKTKSTDVMAQSTKDEYKELLLKAMGEKHDRTKMIEFGKSCSWTRTAEGWHHDFLG